MISAPLLAYPQFKSDVPFVLETDASIQGLGAVLAQNRQMGGFTPLRMCLGVSIVMSVTME